ncbi:MAG: PilZ domain-containing protein [Novosphingobium sp.]
MCIIPAGVVSLKLREPRRRVYVQARMLAGDRWSDVTIQNVSRRGLMAYCSPAPARGDYVELRSGRQVIVGRVAWSTGGTFGLRAQDDIDIDQLTGKTPGPAYSGVERRSAPRTAARPKPKAPPDEAFERSRRIASLLNYVVFAMLAVGAAILLLTAVHSTLSDPLSRATRAMSAAAGPAGLPKLP